MILEAIITSINVDGSMHISAIGPHVDREFKRWELKPFVSSTTYQNLRRTNRCVIHVVDDALLLARVVCRQASEVRANFEPDIGFVIEDACRVFGVELFDWQNEDPRSRVHGKVVWQKELRPFWGWNRAKHAILELAVVATRIGILPDEEVNEAVARARLLVQKTAGDDEEMALQLLSDFIATQLAQSPQKR